MQIYAFAWELICPNQTLVDHNCKLFSQKSTVNLRNVNVQNFERSSLHFRPGKQSSQVQPHGKAIQVISDSEIPSLI